MSAHTYYNIVYYILLFTGRHYNTGTDLLRERRTMTFMK